MQQNSKIIKASDLVISKLVEAGVDTFFGVTGGAAVHFFDSVDKNKSAKSLFLNHEQSASFAVEAYAKIKKGLGAGIFTTGPGATNAITGLAAAWLDSTPCIFISGQSRINSTINGRNIRQVGTQEIDIVSMVASITKYAVTIRDISELSYHLDKAIYLAQDGRKGPSWIDIPVDISWSDIDLSKQRVFLPTKSKILQEKTPTGTKFGETIRKVLNNSDYPLIIVGQGIRSAGVEHKLKSIIEHEGLHFTVTWAMSDFCETDNPLFMGQLGISGQRGANMAVQNSDALICLGTHLNNSITGANYELFAPKAKKIIVSNDRNELEAMNVTADHYFCLNLELALQGWPSLSESDTLKLNSNWSKYCTKYKDLNDLSGKFKGDDRRISSYYLKDFISRRSKGDTIFVTDGGGTNVYSSHQSLRIKEQQRMVLSTGICAMGSGLPEAIGVAFASNHSPTICFVGDGSFPFNVQELQVIQNLKLDIKIFVLNNFGYTSIKTTQNDFLMGNLIGSDAGNSRDSVHTLNVENISRAFQMSFRKISTNFELHEQLDEILSFDGPNITEVIIDADEIVEPRQGFKANQTGAYSAQPLYDMYPFMDTKELNKLLIKGKTQ